MVFRAKEHHVLPFFLFLRSVKEEAWGLFATLLLPLTNIDTHGHESTFVHGGAIPGIAFSKAAKWERRVRYCCSTTSLLFQVRVPPGEMLGVGTQVGSRLKQGIIVLQIEMV
jgi:hypothetical protein